MDRECNCEKSIDLSYDSELKQYTKMQDMIEANHFDAARSEAKDKAIERKGMPVFTGVLKYFPDALKEIAKCSKAGNDQHHADKPLHWDKNKSTDNEDALVRHLIDHSVDPLDDDGILHLTKVAWRSLASLQIYLDKNI